MAKRNSETTQPNSGTSTSGASGVTTDNALERRVLAFAEQLGRVAGTFHVKAEGWMDREALTRQIASVRDGAADRLEHLAGSPTKPAGRVAAAARGQAAKMRAARTMVKTNRRRGRG